MSTHKRRSRLFVISKRLGPTVGEFFFEIFHSDFRKARCAIPGLVINPDCAIASLHRHVDVVKHIFIDSEDLRGTRDRGDVASARCAHAAGRPLV